MDEMQAAEVFDSMQSRGVFERLGLTCAQARQALGRLRGPQEPPRENRRAGETAIRRALRRKTGRGKFPRDFAEAMLDTERLYQQASSWRTASAVGQRLAALARQRGAIRAWDLCCGCGIDAIGLARAGLETVAVDRSVEAVLATIYNATVAGVAERLEARLADVAALDLPSEALAHVDPDRRGGGGRSPRLEDLQPPMAVLERLMARTTAGCVKLSPATDFAALPRRADARAEYLSEGRHCRQLLWWWGDGPVGQPPHAGLPRRATVVYGDADAPRSEGLSCGLAGPAEIAADPLEPGRWLLDPDPAVVAARGCDDLAAAADARRLAPAVPWCVCDEPPATALARTHEILAAVPGRLRDIQRAAKAFDAGEIHIRTANLRLDADSLARKLRGSGPRRLTVFWADLRPRRVALLCVPAA
jgi:hypothetical protein